MSTVAPFYYSQNQTVAVTAISLALAASPYRQLHLLRCDCDLEHDELVLRGTVHSFYLKQLAQETAFKTGCCNLRNEIEVLES